MDIKIRLLIAACFLALLSACGGPYTSRPCTNNYTACTPPAAWNCCSRWGYPYDEGAIEEQQRREERQK